MVRGLALNIPVQMVLTAPSKSFKVKKNVHHATQVRYTSFLKKILYIFAGHMLKDTANLAVYGLRFVHDLFIFHFVGKYCLMPGGANVTGDCSAGYWCINGSPTPTPTDGITGQRCPEGNYCPIGATAPVPCPLGTWSNRYIYIVIHDTVLTVSRSKTKYVNTPNSSNFCRLKSPFAPFIITGVFSDNSLLCKHYIS